MSTRAILHRLCRGFSSISPQIEETASKSLNSMYQIRAACLLERGPITMKAMSKFEAEYEKYRLLLEEENSRGIFRIDGPGAAAEAELSANSINRHLSEDSGEDESAGWRKMVDQIDPAYQNLAMNDLRRELGRKLYLIVREKNSGKWCLPSALVISNAALGSCFDTSRSDIYWTGASPIAAINEPLEGRIKAPLGIKTFVFRGQLIGGVFGRPNSEQVSEFAWMTREEVGQNLDRTFVESLMPVLSH